MATTLVNIEHVAGNGMQAESLVVQLVREWLTTIWIIGIQELVIINCLSLWTVYPCGLSLPVDCLSLWTVYPCGLFIPVDCLSLWTVYPCGLFIPADYSLLWMECV